MNLLATCNQLWALWGDPSVCQHEIVPIGMSRDVDRIFHQGGAAGGAIASMLLSKPYNIHAVEDLQSSVKKHVDHFLHYIHMYICLHYPGCIANHIPLDQSLSRQLPSLLNYLG